MVKHAFDEIILQENRKLGVEDETHENIDDEFDEYELYELDKDSYDENKWHKHEFEIELKTIYNTKIPNDMNCPHDKKVNKKLIIIYYMI